MMKYHTIEYIKFQGNSMILKVDDKEYRFDLETVSQKLSKATDVEREKYEASPSGYGIHWPLIDEDLSIDGLLGISHSPNRIGRKAELQ